MTLLEIRSLKKEVGIATVDLIRLFPGDKRKIALIALGELPEMEITAALEEDPKTMARVLWLKKFFKL